MQDDQPSIEYEVQQILQQKCFKGKPYYLIKWKGFPRAQSTWQPIQNMENSLCYLIEWKKQKIRDNRKKMVKKNIKESHMNKLSKIKDKQDEEMFEFKQPKTHRKVQIEDHKSKIKHKANEPFEKPRRKRLIKGTNVNQLQQIKYKDNPIIIDETIINCNNVKQDESQMNQQKLIVPNLNHLDKLFQREQNEELNESQSSCFSVIEKMNNIPRQMIKKVRRTVIIGDKTYFDLQLTGEKIAMISYTKMKKMFPQILCEYYEQCLIKQK